MSTEATVKFFVTKYALTKGILMLEIVAGDYPYKGMVCGVLAGSGFGTSYFHGEGNEWHQTLGCAVHRAENMRKAKLISMRKQIAKLEKLDFTKKVMA